jgi:UDP-N-acetylmuramoyl-L-alanyl-D-glutamate--2,6-diaminopimelate ligase
VLTDPAGVDLTRGCGLPVLVSDDARRVLGPVAARVYGTDRHRPTLLGVTGTNGKTSTVHMLAAVLDQVGVRSGCSSTVLRRSGSTVVASRLTSPEASELHALLARMTEDGVEAAAIEVSAQAMTHHRTGGIVLDVAGFTNLSHDHLDEYGSMGAYLAAKVALFQPDRARTGIVSLDSDAGAAVVAGAGIPVATLSSTPGIVADWTVRDVVVSAARTSFTVTGPGGFAVATRVPLLGRHMAADCGLAIAMLVAAGYDPDRLRGALGGGVDVDVSGRTALVSGSDGPRVYVDFSHTPDSTEKTLSALREITAGPLVVVLGADGEKDPTKRVPMGTAAARGADVVIVTDHHSRHEDPRTIRAAILRGARDAAVGAAVIEIADSSAAIRHAIADAGPTGTVLWSGPGNVDYRVIGDADVPYSPRFDAARALVEAGWAVPPILEAVQRR